MMFAKERRALQIAALGARRRAEAYQHGIDVATPDDPNLPMFLKGAKIAADACADELEALLADPELWVEAVRDFYDSVPESVDPGARLWQ